MTSNALLPVFLERFESATSVNVWRPLSGDPDPYIWPSLPTAATAVSLRKSKKRQGVSRGRLGRPAVPGELGLRPRRGGKWLTVDALTRISLLLRRRGLIASGDAAIRANVDLETLAIDVVDALDSPADVVAAWHCLSDLKIIDPTPGRAHFCSLRSTSFTVCTAVLDAAIAHARTSKVKALHELLESARSHPNQDYFLLKHAALNNIYGVDIMPEAVEIARLRLFLKLIPGLTIAKIFSRFLISSSASARGMRWSVPAASTTSDLESAC